MMKETWDGIKPEASPKRKKMPTHAEKTEAILGFIQELDGASAGVKMKVAQELSDHPLSWAQIRKIREITRCKDWENVC